jgi:hypothetical protein
LDIDQDTVDDEEPIAAERNRAGTNKTMARYEGHQVANIITFQSVDAGCTARTL